MQPQQRSGSGNNLSGRARSLEREEAARKERESTPPKTAVRRADAKSPQALALAAKRHRMLDASLALALAWLLKRNGGFARLKAMLSNWLQSPLETYTPVFDFANKPMNPALALGMYATDVYFLAKTYWAEKQVVDKAHVKYDVHGTTKYAIAHGIGSVVELTLGLFATLRPENPLLAKLTALLALTVSIPTGLMLNKGVFGIKCLTIPGFFKYAVLRTLESLRVLTLDPKLVPNLWILLHVGTIVRLLGYFVLPYSSKNGRGDLFTETTMYSFNILLSGYLTAAFVYPPKHLLASLGVYMLGQLLYPPRLSKRMMLVEGDGQAEGGKQAGTPLAGKQAS
jgi:hypothetical protein